MGPAHIKILKSLNLYNSPNYSHTQSKLHFNLSRNFFSLTFTIVLQTLLAFAVTCYGIVHIAGEFKDMDATSELKNKTFDTLRNHPSFYVFNHRGRVLFQSSDTVSSSNQDALSSNASLKLRKLEPLRR
uniref:Membrane magnesium transporter 1 n=1 Tax=Ornithorhynchus anatinus TaxID=9258 RepID=A0A6I8NKP2_ORNAN